MSLFDDSGQTQEQRTAEVRRILEKIEELGIADELDEKESDFVHGLGGRKDSPEFAPSARQLFWLRDILSRG